jgi:hypothetical protein
MFTQTVVHSRGQSRSSDHECTRGEYCDVFLTFGTCNNEAGSATLGYRLRHPGRRQPDAKVF